MSPAAPPPVAVDPNLAAEQAKAQNTLVANLQTQAQMDTANIMARYGTHLALAGNSGVSPMAQPSLSDVPAIRF